MKPSRLGSRLVVVMIICSSALALLITLVDVFMSYRDGISRVQHIHRQLALFHSDVLVEQIRTSNDDGTAASLRGLVKLDAIDPPDKQ